MLKHNLFIKLFIVLLVLAPTAAALAYTAPSIWPTGFWGPLVSCTGNYLSANSTGNAAGTCQSLCDLIDTAVNVVYFAMSAAIFIIAPILFIIGGIIMMVSGANPDMLTKGRKTLIDTAIGLAIVLCSYLIVATVVSALQISGIGGFGASACSFSGGGTTTGGSVGSPLTPTGGPVGNSQNVQGGTVGNQDSAKQ